MKVLATRFVALERNAKSESFSPMLLTVQVLARMQTV